MSKSIKISEKYGVNPTIPICFWCGEEKNEIAMLGKLKGDVEAPRSMWIPGDYEPCDKCKEYWNQGIPMIEAYEEPIVYGENQPPFHGAYPTSRHVVIRREAIERMFEEEKAEQILKAGLCFCDHETMERMTKSFAE